MTQFFDNRAQLLDTIIELLQSRFGGGEEGPVSDDVHAVTTRLTNDIFHQSGGEEGEDTSRGRLHQYTAHIRHVNTFDTWPVEQVCYLIVCLLGLFKNLFLPTLKLPAFGNSFNAICYLAGTESYWTEAFVRSGERDRC